MTLNDTRRFYALVRDSGTGGFHSHDARRRGVSGNPSQRAKDIVTKGFPLWTARDSRNGRPGSLYWLDGNQPEHAVAVRPNRAPDRTCESCGASIEHLSTRARFCNSTCRAEHWKTEHGQDDLSVPEHSEAVSEPSGATPLGHIQPAPANTTEPVAIVRDWDGVWRELPVSELEAERRAA